jgi:hypothetical protein
MLHVMLICSDEACAEEAETFGELEDVDDLLCEGCGCLLVPIAFAEAVEAATVIHLAHRPTAIQLRRAA